MEYEKKLDRKKYGPEKNFGLKNILGLKKFDTEKSFVYFQKKETKLTLCFSKTNFVYQKILDRKKFWARKKIWSEKIFLVILGLKKVMGKRNVV